MLESRDQNRRMRDVLDHLPAAICLKDLKGRYQLINRAFESFFRPVRLTSSARPIWTCSPANRPSASAPMKTGCSKPARMSKARTCWNANGQPRTVQSTSSFRCCARMARSMRWAVSISTSPNRGKRTKRCTSFAGRSGTPTAWRAPAPSRLRSPTRLCQPLSAILNNAQAGLRFLAQDRVDLDEMREILQDIVRDDKRAADRDQRLARHAAAAGNALMPTSIWLSASMR